MGEEAEEDRRHGHDRSLRFAKNLMFCMLLEPGAGKRPTPSLFRDFRIDYARVMRRARALVNSILTLVLILNGMSATAVSAHSLPTPANSTESTNCHDHDLASHLDELRRNSDTAGNTDQCADCCKDSACQCGCVHQASSALVTPWLLRPEISHAAIGWGQLPVSAIPALGHLIRPPIA